MSEHVGATVQFCGETYPVAPGSSFTIGRVADLSIDDNLFLHRHFLEISEGNGWWWLSNVGSRLTATVADESGAMHAWLAPGARIPLVFARTAVLFTAGPTTYDFEIEIHEAPFAPVIDDRRGLGATTLGVVSLTPDQRLMILALCESALRSGTRTSSAVPSSADAATRLGWTLTKFNRKLDNVCDRLTKLGIRGLHGGPQKLAMNRRARLVEYAIAARLVQPQDLGLLDVQPVSSPQLQ